MRRTQALTILPALMAAGLLLSACGDASPAAPAEPQAAAMTTAPNTVMPDDAPPQEEAGATLAETVPQNGIASGPCVSDIGQNASARLVERCIAVSPATHPPCNAQNSCAMIQDEITRSCDQYGPGEKKPDACSA